MGNVVVVHKGMHTREAHPPHFVGVHTTPSVFSQALKIQAEFRGNVDVDMG